MQVLEYFYLLLQASLLSAVAVCVILILRLLLKDRVDRRVFILLWAIVLFRLLIISSITSPISFANFLPDSAALQNYLPFAQQNSEQNAVVGEAVVQMDEAANETANTAQTQPVFVEAAGTETEIPWLFTIWLIGATAMITSTGILYLLFQFKSRNIIYLPDIGYEQDIGDTKVFLSDQVTSPVTIGIFKPQIHLPDNLDFRDKNMVRHVLVHEMTHIKRYDNLLKLVMMLALSLHWFNPFAWILCRTLNKDIECSCDMATIDKIGAENKSDYANTLVTMAERSSDANVAGLVFVSFEGSFLKERVLNIMRKKYPAVLSIIIATIFSVGIFAVFATNAPTINASDNLFSPQTITLTLVKKAEQDVDAKKELISDVQAEKIPVDKTVYKIDANRIEKTASEASFVANKDTKEVEINTTTKPEEKLLESIDTKHKKGAAMLSFEQAQERALRIVDGQIIKWKLDADEKGTEYEFEIIKDNIKYEVDIDAYTGELLEYEKKGVDKFKVDYKQAMITAEKARNIALQHTGSGIVTKCTLDSLKEYNHPVYDVDVRVDNVQYKYHINAFTGEVVKQKIENK